MDGLRAGPRASVLVGSLYGHNETRSLPVSHWSRVVCRKPENEAPMATSESFTKRTGDSATERWTPGDGNLHGHRKWLERLGLNKG